MRNLRGDRRDGNGNFALDSPQSGRRAGFEIHVGFSRDSQADVSDDPIESELLGVFGALSTFYLVAGLVYPRPSTRSANVRWIWVMPKTGLLAASTGAGIAAGCVIAGLVCRDRVRGWWFDLELGAYWPTCCCSECRLSIRRDVAWRRWIGGGTRGGGIVRRVFYCSVAGLYTSESPRRSRKGRMIAAMNLLKLIGICLSRRIYGLAYYLLVGVAKQQPSAVFFVAAIMILTIAAFYRPPNLELRSSASKANLG